MTFWALLALTAARAADLYTTWLVTPDLRFEVNPIPRLLGWRNILILNTVCCPIVAAIGGVVVWVIGTGSLLLAVWNFYLWARYVRKRI